MAPLTESAAEKFGREQASELARVLDMHAKWENLRQDRPPGTIGYTTPDLQSRQRAYDAYHARRAAYQSRFGSAEVPEASVNTPVRVAGWCRLVLAVCRRADPTDEAPLHLIEKAQRLAHKLAVRLARSPLAVTPPANMGDAARALEAVAAWCDSLTIPEARPTAA